MFSIYIVTLIMQSLYLNRKLLIGYGSGLTFVLLAIYFISPASLIGEGVEAIEFISPMGAFVCAFIVLSLLTTWGQESLENAQA